MKWALAKWDFLRKKYSRVNIGCPKIATCNLIAVVAPGSQSSFLEMDSWWGPATQNPVSCSGMFLTTGLLCKQAQCLQRAQSRKDCYVLGANCGFHWVWKCLRLQTRPWSDFLTLFWEDITKQYPPATHTHKRNIHHTLGSQDKLGANTRGIYFLEPRVGSGYWALTKSPPK